MPSRKDQLHSYQFMLQRTISALVMRETDPAQSPLRRGVGAAFVGIMVTVIAAAAFGIYGLLTKVGSAKWKVEGAVVVEKENGGTYVYLGGKLVPTLNYTSALLLSGKTPPARFTVPGNSLAGIPRDITRGIQNAPGALPNTKHVLGRPWSMCTLPAKNVAGQATVTTVLSVGENPLPDGVLGDRGLYLRDRTTRDEFLVWRGHRFRVYGKSVTSALFGSGIRPVQVGSSWLNAIPEGDRIRAIDLPDWGKPSDDVSGRRIGDVVVDARGSGNVNYLVVSDGLARLSELQYDVLRVERQIVPTTLPPDEIANAPKSGQLASESPPGQQAPGKAPQMAPATATSALCAEFVGNAAPVTHLATHAFTVRPGTPTGSQTPAGSTVADYVAVRGGWVAVVKAHESGTYSIITSVGIRYPVESADVLSVLGYKADDAVELPTALLNRVPTGPSLTRAAAGTPAVGSESGGN